MVYVPTGDETQITALQEELMVTKNQLSEALADKAALEEELAGKTEIVIPEPPQTLTQLTHREVMDILRDKFPQTMFRGVEAPIFEITSLSEVKRFLDEDRTDEEDLGGNQGDYVFRLMGQFNSPGWEKIPFGWAKTDNDIYNIVILKDGSKIKVFGIDPTTDRLWEISTAANVKFVLIG
jgi:hypothetical protein